MPDQAARCPGFWNARAVEHLLCVGALANTATWLTHSRLLSVPCPTPDLVAILQAEPPCGDLVAFGRSHLGRDHRHLRRCVDRTALVWLVAATAAETEAAVRAVADHLEAHRGDRTPAECWLAFTGCAPGGRAHPEEDLAKRRHAIHPDLPELVSAAEGWRTLCGEAVAALFPA